MTTKIIDLRSDTVTKPTKEMLEAIIKTPLGDDVVSEDPTVNELENRAAKLFNKEAALLVVSGTMGNLLGVLSQTTPRGSEIIVNDQAHIAYYEVGGVSALGGVMVRTVPSSKKNGFLNPEDVINAIREPNIHFPETTLVSLENTHNRYGGIPLTVEEMESIGKIAKEYDLAYHVDGARIFNAAMALDVPVAQLTSSASSIQFCLSKGLSCPVGSLLVGSQMVINKARKLRKMLGGGMRQAGIIAAPGLVALDNLDRLKKDHENARKLAKGIESMDLPSITVTPPPTNIVNLHTSSFDAQELVTEAARHNIKFFATGKHKARLVTHREISTEDIENVLRVLEPILLKLESK